ncbi:hypothetical protein C8R45DRAFT_1076168 [Mycena sanguinolenta]|nr:hypothetical protein C8R45DRAFT_1076168 [Mycena sanguinolenta]
MCQYSLSCAECSGRGLYLGVIAYATHLYPVLPTRVHCSQNASLTLGAETVNYIRAALICGCICLGVTHIAHRDRSRSAAPLPMQLLAVYARFEPFIRTRCLRAMSNADSQSDEVLCACEVYSKWSSYPFKAHPRELKPSAFGGLEQCGGEGPKRRGNRILGSGPAHRLLANALDIVPCCDWLPSTIRSCVTVAVALQAYAVGQQRHGA